MSVKIIYNPDKAYLFMNRNFINRIDIDIPNI